MKRYLHWTAAACAVAVMLPAFAQPRAELGRFEFESNCASCHGTTGTGDGYYAQFLRMPAPNLTTITERNGGVFPAERLLRIVDGREDVKGHGMRQMPVWGAHYNERAAQYYKGYAHDPETFTRVRIVALVDHLYALQTRR